MKILVTGSYGQLGSEIRELASDFPDWNFLFTDVDTLDVTNEKAVNIFFTEQKPKYTINCAAYVAVDKAENDPDKAQRVNSLASEILGKASKKVKSKVIHISTDYVFNGRSYRPYNENDQTDPQGVYGKTKLQGEINILTKNPASLVLRTSWLYSSFGNNFVKTMLRLAGERDELRVVYDQVGSPTYGADLARAVLHIIQLSEKEPERFVPGIYHFSNEGVASWYDFAKAIFEISEIEIKINPVLTSEFPTPAKRPEYSVLNKSKIRHTFGLEIPYWKDSLNKCLEKISKKSNNEKPGINTGA